MRLEYDDMMMIALHGWRKAHARADGVEGALASLTPPLSELTPSLAKMDKNEEGNIQSHIGHARSPESTWIYAS